MTGAALKAAIFTAIASVEAAMGVTSLALRTAVLTSANTAFLAVQAGTMTLNDVLNIVEGTILGFEITFSVQIGAVVTANTYKLSLINQFNRMAIYFGMSFAEIEAAVWEAFGSIAIAAGVSTSAVIDAINTALYTIALTGEITVLDIQWVLASAIMMADVALYAANDVVLVADAATVDAIKATTAAAVAAIDLTGDVSIVAV